MFRNSNIPTHDLMNTRSGSGSLPKLNSASSQYRTPLYPVGPTITHKGFNTNSALSSPYLSVNKQNIMPPSYEQRYLRTEMSLGNGAFHGGNPTRTYNHELREKQLIDRNQQEIKEEQRRRGTLQSSYEREIDNLNKKLSRNVQRKETLITEISVLEQTHSELNLKLSQMVTPKVDVAVFEPAERKQQEIQMTKNRLLAQVREHETEFMNQEEEEEKYWESAIKEKQKELLRAEENSRLKRLQLHSLKSEVEKPDYLAIEDEVREFQYQSFLEQASLIEQKISQAIRQREDSQRQVEETLKNGKQSVQATLLRHQQLSRECVTFRIRAEELERVSQEMEAANENLMKESERKEQMIEKYELDIHSLKEKKTEQEDSLGLLMKEARDKGFSEMDTQIGEEIQRVQSEIRDAASITNRLKSQYQKLYEMLCSTASKNIHETFSETLTV